MVRKPIVSVFLDEAFTKQKRNKKSPSQHLVTSVRDFAAAKSCWVCTQKRNQ